MISKDTAYIDDEGVIHRETITRPLSGPWDFVNTYIVNIYPVIEECITNICIIIHLYGVTFVIFLVKHRVVTLRKYIMATAQNYD